jgi:hypothetical protein
MHIIPTPHNQISPDGWSPKERLKHSIVRDAGQRIETVVSQIPNAWRELEPLQVIERIHQLCKPCRIDHHFLNGQLRLVIEHRIQGGIGLAHMRRDNLDVGVGILIANHVVQIIGSVRIAENR